MTVLLKFYRARASPAHLVEMQILMQQVWGEPEILHLRSSQGMLKLACGLHLGKRGSMVQKGFIAQTGPVTQEEHVSFPRGLINLALCGQLDPKDRSLGWVAGGGGKLLDSLAVCRFSPVGMGRSEKLSFSSASLSLLHFGLPGVVCQNIDNCKKLDHCNCV